MTGVFSTFWLEMLANTRVFSVTVPLTALVRSRLDTSLGAESLSTAERACYNFKLTSSAFARLEFRRFFQCNH